MKRDGSTFEEVEVYGVRDEDGVSFEHDTGLPVDTTNAPHHYIDNRLVSDGQHVMTVTIADGQFTKDIVVEDEVATDRAYDSMVCRSQQPSDAYCGYCGETNAVVRGGLDSSSVECIECETVMLCKSKEQHDEICDTDMTTADIVWDASELPNILTGDGMVTGVGCSHEIGAVSSNSVDGVKAIDGPVRTKCWNRIVNDYIDTDQLEPDQVAFCVKTDAGGRAVRVHIDPRCANDRACEHARSDSVVDQYGYDVYVEHSPLQRAGESE
jgi:hypothetical protein